MHTSEASSRSEGSKTIARPYCLLARMFKFASLCNDYQQGVLQNNDKKSAKYLQIYICLAERKYRQPCFFSRLRQLIVEEQASR